MSPNRPGKLPARFVVPPGKSVAAVASAVSFPWMRWSLGSLAALDV